MEPVPASKKIRKGRAGNIDDDRLQRRREFLADVLSRGETGTSDDSRLGFALKAGEMGQIEDELVGRGLLDSGSRRSLSPQQFAGRRM